MKRQVLRFFLAATLAGLTVILGMMWAEEYDSSPDPKARFEIQGVKLKQDHGFVWMEVHMKKSGKEDHDLKQLVFLVTADGKKHEPADTTFAGTPEAGFSEIWYKFWLEKKELKGELKLTMNGGTLNLKSSEAIPLVGSRKERIFKSSDWEKIWPGF